jgi:hypothetical protein
MRTRITRPTLSELWRVLLTTLEDLGAEEASVLARSLAIAVLTGRPAGASGVRVERQGADMIVTAPDRSRTPSRPGARHGARPRRRRRPRRPHGALTRRP